METYQEKALRIAYEYLSKVQGIRMSQYPLYVVWSCKTLQNWKCLISSPYIGSLELTYNGDKKETYVDFYVKRDNYVARDTPVDREFTGFYDCNGHKVYDGDEVIIYGDYEYNGNVYIEGDKVYLENTSLKCTDELTDEHEFEVVKKYIQN